MDATTETYVSIAEIKKRLSEITNQVAYGGKQVVLTSRGRPKAVMISVEDYEQFKRWQRNRQQRLKGLETMRQHREAIRRRRGGSAMDIDIAAWLQDMRQERVDDILEPIHGGD